MKRKIVIAGLVFVAVLFGSVNISYGYEKIILCDGDNPNIVAWENDNASLLLADSNYKQEKNLGKCNRCYSYNNLIIVMGPSIKDGKFKYNTEYEYVNIFNKDGKYIDALKNCKKSHSVMRYIVLYDGENSIVIDSYTEEIVGKFNYEIEEVLLDNQNKYYFVANDNGKCGIIDKDKQIHLPFIYSSVYKFLSPSQKEDNSSFTFRIRKDKKYGVCKQDGEIVVPVEYDKIENLSCNNGDDNIHLLLRFKKGNKKIIVDSNGKEVNLLNEYDEVVQYGNNIYEVSKNNKLGIVTFNNEIIVPLEYDYTTIDYENKIIIAKKNFNGKEDTNVFDIKGNLISSINYDKVDIINDRVAIISKNNKYGVVSIQDNKEIIPAKYDFIREGFTTDYNSTNYLNIQKGKYNLWNATYGVATKEGKVILETEYDSINYFELNDFISARKNNMGYLFDKNGNVLIDGFRGNILNVFTNKGRYYAIVSNSWHKQNYKDITKEVLGQS